MKKFINIFILLLISSVMYGQDVQLLQKAKEGDAESQYKLYCYYLPNSKAVNEEGVKWLIEAAENGYAPAQYDLVNGYHYGWFGVTINYVKYVYWLKKAADHTTVNCNKTEKHQIASAQYNLGRLYWYGEDGVEENKSEAIKWYKKSAFNGYSPAAYALGLDYKDEDYQEAIYWLKKCMDMYWEEYGDEHERAFDALRKLGVTYHPGDHVGQNSSSSSASTVDNQNSGGTSHTRQAQQVWKERWKPCISCDPDRKGRCNQCHGRGYYYIGNIHNICTSCNGTGACVWCGGRGEIKETYSVWE